MQSTPGIQLTPGEGVGRLTVHVRLTGRRGVTRAGDEPAGLVDIGPAAGAIVRVEAPGDQQAVLETRADAEGTVQADVPSGTYVIFVPWSAEVPGLPGAEPSGASLPDGRPVSAWTEATVSAEAASEATLVITIALP
jgi:hypothetical protein